MGEADRKRHQFLGFLDGVTEHHALVTGTLLVIFLTVGGLGVHALGDIGGLLVHSDEHGAALVVEGEFRIHVADTLDGLAGNLLVVNHSLGGDFAGNHDEARVHERFASHAAVRVLREAGVEDSVRNLVADFVRMSLGHGFRSKEIMCHVGSLMFSAPKRMSRF